MQETHIQSLGCKDPLGEEMATQSSILAWKLPYTYKNVRIILFLYILFYIRLLVKGKHEKQVRLILFIFFVRDGSVSSKFFFLTFCSPIILLIGWGRETQTRIIFEVFAQIKKLTNMCLDFRYSCFWCLSIHYNTKYNNSGCMFLIMFLFIKYGEHWDKFHALGVLLFLILLLPLNKPLSGN